MCTKNCTDRGLLLRTVCKPSHHCKTRVGYLQEQGCGFCNYSRHKPPTYNCNDLRHADGEQRLEHPQVQVVHHTLNLTGARWLDRAWPQTPFSGLPQQTSNLFVNVSNCACMGSDHVGSSVRHAVIFMPTSVQNHSRIVSFTVRFFLDLCVSFLLCRSRISSLAVFRSAFLI